MMFENSTVGRFLDDLAGPASTPGGGAAAAVMGSMGAALVSMVCNLTIGKKQYTAVESDIKALLEKSEALRTRLAGMMNDDAAVFAKVIAAYGMPKDSDEQKAKRADAIEAALKQATLVPLACARACAEVIDLSRAAAEKGNRSVVSDAGVAVHSAFAGLRSAALNVYVNAPAIRDRGFSRASVAEVEALLGAALATVDEVLRTVGSRMQI